MALPEPVDDEPPPAAAEPLLALEPFGPEPLCPGSLERESFDPAPVRAGSREPFAPEPLLPGSLAPESFDQDSFGPESLEAGSLAPTLSAAESFPDEPFAPSGARLSVR